MDSCLRRNDGVGAGYCGLFSYQSLMSVVTDNTNHENVLTQKKGNHKGCPYDGLA